MAASVVLAKILVRKAMSYELRFQQNFKISAFGTFPCCTTLWFTQSIERIINVNGLISLLVMCPSWVVVVQEDSSLTLESNLLHFIWHCSSRRVPKCYANEYIFISLGNGKCCNLYYIRGIYYKPLYSFHYIFVVWASGFLCLTSTRRA